MGASGGLIYISLKERGFKEIKELMLKGLSKAYSDSYKPEYEKYFFKVAKMNNFNDFCYEFGVKVLDYENDHDHEINYSGDYFPQVDGEYLILYETELCMEYQMYPCWMLRELSERWEEIWT
jgi:hypothetical protein